MYYVGLFTDRPARSTAMPVLFHSVVQNFGVFRPAGATCCPDKREIWHGGKNVGIQPQNCQNFEFWPEIFTSGATRLQYFYEIFSVCTRL